MCHIKSPRDFVLVFLSSASFRDNFLFSHVKCGFLFRFLCDGPQLPRLPHVVLLNRPRHLTLDIPATPLFKDSQGGNIIPQIPLFKVLDKYNGQNWTVSMFTFLLLVQCYVCENASLLSNPGAKLEERNVSCLLLGERCTLKLRAVEVNAKR